MEEVINDALKPEDFALDHLGVVEFLCANDELFLLQEKCSLDGGERIADLMRHAGGEHAERGKLFRAFNQLLAFDEAATHRRDHVAVDNPSERESKNEKQPQGDQRGDTHLGDGLAGAANGYFP